MPSIAVGEMLPDGTLTYFNEIGNLKPVSIHALAAGKKVVVLGVVGAFTPRCSWLHVQGFIDRYEELKAKGIEDILVISVNDAFTMKAWKSWYPDTKNMKFLGDGSAKYTYTLGMELDLSNNGLGVRSRRYALVVDDLEIVIAKVESGGDYTVARVFDILAAL
ncbi:peroxiredoxin-2B-like [Cynara cardunculus var. scolymus]|uniref:Glutaredoxin-dependent peroxiredoxin n=1 Tax=Cynara cardunculus var. scolymus TaxID=59895 RepID=A0A103XNG2_CYNCS|nr:peroxiredoxin-2B-like [Cynara cardunculus var. scolymus]KVH93890.1 Redoxin [Cynara cardunculus var. scolymus]